MFNEIRNIPILNLLILNLTICMYRLCSVHCECSAIYSQKSKTSVQTYEMKYTENLSFILNVSCLCCNPNVSKCNH